MNKFILNILIITNFIFSQVSIDSSPKSFLSNRNLLIEEINLPPIDIDQLIEEDQLEIQSNLNKPYRFAKTINVNLNMENSGIWTVLEDGSSIWQLKINSNGAYSLNLIYDIFHIPNDAEFFLYSNNREIILGAFTSFNHKPHGGFSTAPIKGDSIILEYNQPAGSDFNGEISISSIAHDYKNIFSENVTRGYGDSGSCNNNVVCDEGDNWQDEVNSVAMILTSGGSRICTGSLINNTSGDLTPYFLTANHCLGGNNSWIFMFNYQSPSCSNQDGPTNMTISGSTLLTSSSTSDFALLELNESPPEEYNVFYAGWDITGDTPNTPVCIHHPSGDIKKISFDYENASDAGNFWDINNWEDGTTEPGSSGSPLFDGNTKRIIGQLYGGTASCSSITYDTYGKTSISWGLGMNTYLDPSNSGLQVLDGTNASSGISISHESFNDVPYDSNSMTFSAEITNNTGNIEIVELYYKLDDRFENQEMSSSFGNNYQTTISNLYDGMLIEYYLQAINSEGEIATFPANAPDNTILFILGDLPNLYTNNFETNIDGWIIGDTNDSATAGIWELAEPVATYDDENNQIQPNGDFDQDGTFCFITGNGNEENNGGYDDVDGGKTTLYSPVFNINNLNEVIVTYWRWYTNNVGDNGDNDKWIVSVSDNGINWINLENTSQSNISWDKQRFILSDYINLNETLQFKFIAEDIFYDGDDGSGGSLVEAAIDNFTIEYIGENINISGDLNNDSNVDVLDVVLIVNMILTNDESNANADINLDGEINVQDVVTLISLILQN